MFFHRFDGCAALFPKFGNTNVVQFPNQAVYWEVVQLTMKQPVTRRLSGKATWDAIHDTVAVNSKEW